MVSNIEPADRPPLAIDEEARERLEAVFAAHPTIGYRRALREAGFDVRWRTHAECRALILADSDLSEAANRSLGIDEPHLLLKLAAIVHNDDNPAQLKAILAALRIRHGIADAMTVDHTGQVEVRNQDVSDAIDRFTQAVASATLRAAPDRGEGVAPLELDAGPES